MERFSTIWPMEVSCVLMSGTESVTTTSSVTAPTGSVTLSAAASAVWSVIDGITAILKPGRLSRYFIVADRQIQDVVNAITVRCGGVDLVGGGLLGPHLCVRITAPWRIAHKSRHRSICRLRQHVRCCTEDQREYTKAIFFI